MPKIAKQLDLPRCPHCGVDTPTLTAQANCEGAGAHAKYLRLWYIYICARCGGAILAGAPKGQSEVYELYPSVREAHSDLPERARAYLQQAIDSQAAPVGAVMLAASAVDSMLKARGLKTGTLYARIDQAKDENLITSEMAAWAHEVRLDANENRHADETIPMPSIQDAQRAIDFAEALGQFLFVLPSRVRRGRVDSNNGVAPEPRP